MGTTTILATAPSDVLSATRSRPRHWPHRLVGIATLACIGLATGCTESSRASTSAIRGPQSTLPSEGIVPVTTSSARALAAFRAGRGHQASRRIDEARAAYHDALAEDPGFAQAHVFLGAVSTEVAVRARSFERARELAVTLPAAEQSFIAAVIAAHGDDPTALAAALEQLTRAASQDVEVLRWVASVAGSRGSTAAALPALERIVALAPDAVAEHAELAYTYAALDRPRDATTASARYVELAPADANAWDTHGEMLLLAGELDGAERAFRRALAVDERFCASYHGMAMVRFHRGDHAGGVEALLAGIATVPVEDTTYARVRLLENLAVAHALAGHEQDAFEAMLASVEAQHLDEATARAVSHMGRARLLLFMQQWARVQAEAAAARSGGAPPFVVPAALAVEVRALASAGDASAVDAAYATLAKTAAGGHPAVVEATLFVALAKGQLEQASTTLGQLGALDPYAAELASLELARAFRKAGRDPEARALLQTITRRHHRSAQSAHVRRAAAAELAAMGSTAATQVLSLHTGRAFRFKGLAIDTKAERAYLGSWDAKELVVVDLRHQTHHVISTKFRGKLNAMGVYLRAGKLYAVMNEVDDRRSAKPRSVLVVIDTATETVSRTYELRGAGGRHHFNHVVVDRRGIAYVSDTLHATIHRVDTEDPAARLEPLVTHESLSWVHGIDLSRDESKLFSTSYQGGIKIFDLKTRELAPYADPVTAGDDGLAYHEGHLYGIGQNTLTRYRLNEAEDAVVGSEVLLRDHERFNDPRDLHIEDGVIYCLANIEHDAVTFSHGTARQGRAQDDTHLVEYRL